MEDHLKAEFAKRLGYGIKPGDLPQRYIDFYDQLGKKWLAMLSNREPPRTEWAVIALLSEMFHDLNCKITQLEDSLHAMNTVKTFNGAVISESIAELPGPAATVTDPMPVKKKHWKTIQAEQKAAMAGAA